MKWPVAIASLAVLPGCLIAWKDLILDIVNQPKGSVPFWTGFVGYFLAWFILLKRRFMGSFFSTFEHELTHVIFAFLTFHRVTKFKITWNSGGKMAYLGGDNWLIVLAPYFFPTFSMIILGLFLVLPFQYNRWLTLLFGVSVAYHMISTWTETRFRQSDLKIAGWIFSTLFLPVANLLVFGILLSFSIKQPGGVEGFIGATVQGSKSLIVRFMPWTAF